MEAESKKYLNETKNQVEYLKMIVYNLDNQIINWEYGHIYFVNICKRHTVFNTNLNQDHVVLIMNIRFCFVYNEDGDCVALEKSTNGFLDVQWEPVRVLTNPFL